MKIKIIQNKEIRVWKYPHHNKYQTLLKFIAKTYGYSNPSSYNLQYQDDEGDNINIRNDNDIDDALLFAKEECRKSLKIYLISSAAMDNFLDDALSDLFGPSPSKPMHKPISKAPKRIKTIQKRNHKQHHPKFPIKSNRNLPIESNSNFQFKSNHNVQFQSHPNVAFKSNANIPIKIQSPLNTLSPKEMLDIIPNKPSNTKAMIMNPEDILASMFEEDIISPRSQASVHSKPPILSASDVLNSMDIHIEPHSMHNINHEASKPNNIDGKPKYIIPQPVHNDMDDDNDSEDLLQNLLNDDDKSMPIMDPQDVINSIINKQNSDNNNVFEPETDEEHEEDEQQRVEESVSELILVEAQPIEDIRPIIPSPNVLNNNNDTEEALHPPQVLHPTNEVNTQYTVPTIQTKVPPAPFLQRYHSPMNDERNGISEEYTIANGHQEMQNDDDDNDDTLNLLRQFDALPDVPQHIVSNIESTVDDDVDEEKLIPEAVLDTTTLEEIQESLANPMNFHDTNLAEIKQDLQLEREELKECVEREKEDEDGDDEEHVDSEDGNDDGERVHVDIKGDECIGNAELNENACVDEDDNDGYAKDEDNDDDSDNNNDDKYQNEINKLYAELDDIDMEFEIDRLKADHEDIKQDETEHKSDEEDEEDGIEISRMNGNIVNDIQQNDVIDDNEIGISRMDGNIEEQNNGVNDVEQNVESEETEESDDGEDMDLTRTTPDPPLVKEQIEADSNDATDDTMDISDEREPESVDIQCIQQKTDIEHVQNDKNEENTENIQNIEENTDKEASDTMEMDESSSTDIMNMKSPRDQKREIARILREKQREQQKKEKMAEKQCRMAQKQKEQKIRKNQKEKEKEKRFQQKEIEKISKKYDKLRRIRSRELIQFRSISTKENDIFTPNKAWFPIKFVLDTTNIEFEFETVSDLEEIIELETVKRYRVYPSNVECVFNHENVHKMIDLPSSKHCIVYVYYNWTSIQSVKFQSINLGLCDEYIVKINVFRIGPWINTKQICDETESDAVTVDMDPNQYLESQIMKYKALTTKETHKSSPLSLFKFNKKKENESEDRLQIECASSASLLPDNCDQTPNFRWKFDLTQDYAAFDPLLNDDILSSAMHPFEIYFVQIRSDAVCDDAPDRMYSIYVMYLECCEDDEIANLLCNVSSKGDVDRCNDNRETKLLLLGYVDNEECIVCEIFSFLESNRCYGFVCVSRNTLNHSEQITFHYGSIGDWIKCAIVGENDFERDLLNLQKYAKWNNKQHLSLCAFLNGIVTTYSM